MGDSQVKKSEVIEAEVLDETTRRALFIDYSARGYSTRAIAKELRISKNKAYSMKKELDEEIAERKEDLLSETYARYGLDKATRISKLGEALQKIDAEINKRDLSDASTDKLLDLKLKYAEALKDEYIPLRTEKGKSARSVSSSEDIMSSLSDLLDRVKNGDATKEQAHTELSILAVMTKALEDVELERKINYLQEAL